jgi:hypothetical protein
MSIDILRMSNYPESQAGRRGAEVELLVELEWADDFDPAWEYYVDNWLSGERQPCVILMLKDDGTAEYRDIEITPTFRGH